MRRSLSIFLWILVGALAAGGGVGYFLHVANQDRMQLVEQAQRAERQAQQQKAANAQLATEANTKLKDASAQIQRAKDELAAHQKHEVDLAAALPLPKPLPRTLRNWNQTFSIHLGLSLLVPPFSYATETDNGLNFLRASAQGDMPWMTVIPYDADHEQQWSAAVTNTVPILYTFDHQHTLTGVRGMHQNTQATIYLLRLQNFSTSTHLFWIESHYPVDEQEILQTLSTLSVNP